MCSSISMATKYNPKPKYGRCVPKVTYYVAFHLLQGIGWIYTVYTTKIST